MQRDDRKLSFTLALLGMMQQADVVFIAVSTSQGEDGSADLSSVVVVARTNGVRSRSLLIMRLEPRC